MLTSMANLASTLRNQSNRTHTTAEAAGKPGRYEEEASSPAEPYLTSFMASSQNELSITSNTTHQDSGSSTDELIQDTDPPRKRYDALQYQVEVLEFGLEEIDGVLVNFELAHFLFDHVEWVLSWNHYGKPKAVKVQNSFCAHNPALTPSHTQPSIYPSDTCRRVIEMHAWTYAHLLHARRMPATTHASRNSSPHSSPRPAPRIFSTNP